MLETQLCCQNQPSKVSSDAYILALRVPILLKHQFLQFASWFLNHLGHLELVLSFLYSPENQNQLGLIGNSQVGALHWSQRF